MPTLDVQIPLLAIGLTMAAYWYRVLRMARKLRERIGRSGNLIPPERLGRRLRLVWTPVIAVWIVHPLASGVTRHLHGAFGALYNPGWLRIVCAAVVLGGFAVTRRCWKRMGNSWRMGIDPGDKTDLIFDGLYGYVRHPIYALSALMMLATMVALPSPIMLLAGIAHIALLRWEAAREEQHLIAVHGLSYDAYRRHVGRIVPRSLRPYAPNADISHAPV